MYINVCVHNKCKAEFCEAIHLPGFFMCVCGGGGWVGGLGAQLVPMHACSF